MSCVSAEKLIRDSVVAPFLQLSVVFVTLPPGTLYSKILLWHAVLKWLS